MKNVFRLFTGAAMAVAFLSQGALAATVTSETAVPICQAPELQGASLRPVQGNGFLVPTITWGGDTLAVYANNNGLFSAEGLSVSLYHEDNFAKQLRNLVDGKTAFIRGTFGMQKAAADCTAKLGTGLVPINQITWSNGGDRLVVRNVIRSLSDLRGKRIALQLYGPHMDFLTTILNRAGLKLSDVEVVWFKELSVPSYDTKGQVLDARTAFQQDPSIAAAFVISPDADVLTSNGAAGGGNGTEGSVKGAKVLFSSKSANRIIADTWAVRQDFYDAHRAEVQKFVHAILVSEQQFTGLLANPASNKAKYDATVTASGKLFEISKGDVEGLLGDCEFVGFNGNVGFFNGAGTTRNFSAINGEIERSFQSLKVIAGAAPLTNPNWDYSTLTGGLTNVSLASIPAVAPKFDAVKVQRKVEQEIASEPASWGQKDTLYTFEIYFIPNQAAFSAKDYATDFQRILESSQTFGGAIVTIEGHNAPDLLNRAKASGNQQEITTQTQLAKNLSLKRAQAVRDAYINFAKAKGIPVDTSQLVSVGMGATSPKYNTPKTEQEWKENMRVVFRLKQVETELTTFQVPGK